MSQETFFSRISSIEKICFQFFLGLETKNFDSWQKIWDNFSKVQFTCQHECFLGISFWSQNFWFHYFVWTMIKTTRTFIQKLSTRLWKLHSSKPADSFRKKVYRENLKILINFELLANFLWTFGQKKFLELSKVPPICPEEQLEEKEFFFL